MSIAPLVLALFAAGTPPPTPSAAGRTATPSGTRPGAVRTPPAVVALGGGEVRWSGERISIEVKDADLVDVILALAKTHVTNVVVDPDVKGSVTTSLTDVPWDQALDVLLRGRGYATRREGNVLRVAPVAKLLASP